MGAGRKGASRIYAAKSHEHCNWIGLEYMPRQRRYAFYMMSQRKQNMRGCALRTWAAFGSGCLLVCALTACGALQPAGQRESAPKPTIAVTPDLVPEDSASTEQQRQAETAGTERSVPAVKLRSIREIGSGRLIGETAKVAGASETEEGELTLNFQQADLREVVKVVLGDLLEQNYVIDEQVAGRVTVETARPLPREALLVLLEDLLAMNGAALVRKGELYQVLPRNRAVPGNLAPTSAGGVQTGFNARIIPLRYVSASQLKEILQGFLRNEGELRINKERNLLIASGTPEELDLLQETVDIFDVNWMKGMSMGMYPLEYVDPRTIQKDLQAILGDRKGAPDELLGGLARTVPIERLNSVLLISTTPEALREAELWLYRLDRPGEQIGRRLYVHPVQNAKATDIAEILNSIFSARKDKRGSTGEEPVALAPGSSPVEIGTAPTEQIEQSPSQPLTQTGLGEGGEGGVVLPSSEAVEIIADDTRNSLVILASPQDYKMMASAISKLDTVPLQVLIQTGIIEVTLNDDLDYGIEWFFNNSLGRGRSGNLQLDLGEASGVTRPGSALSYTIVNSADQIRLVLSALAEQTNVNILSTPSLMVLDNQTAKINVGDEIPIPTRQSISNVDPQSPTVNEIEFRSTGVSLTVTPRVNSGGLVTMEIEQEVSNAIATTSSTLNAPTIQQRQLESVVAINSGQTLVLGGLIRERNTVQDSGIPGLKNLPVLGKLLFGRVENEDRRTELLVLITPRVIRNQSEAREITEELKRQLSSPFIEQAPPSEQDAPG